MVIKQDGVCAHPNLVTCCTGSVKGTIKELTDKELALAGCTFHLPEY